MPTSLLKFQIGPVQDFIAKARKTQDLWAGSWLLSHLTSTGALAAQAAGGEVLYPMLGKQNDQLVANTPNLFLARAETVDKIKEVAQAAEAAIRREWQKIATEVHAKLSSCSPDGWDAGWHRQVTAFPVIDWIIHPCSENSKALMLLKEGTPPLPANTPAFSTTGVCLDGLHIATVEWKFAARKNARTFAGWKGLEAPKDHLDGFHEVMGGPDHERFWSKLRSTAPFKHALRGQQLYGAMTLIKRLFPEFYLHDKLGWKDFKPDFDSVHHIAAAIDAEEGEVPPDSPSYYAILAMDGDDMGQWVSGCKGASDGLDPLKPGYHSELSKKLSAFALQQVPGIMKRFQAKTIYCGGDDVLAMLPAARALDCAAELAEAFSKTLPGATASVGIAIGHVRAPLQSTIQAARDAESTAKRVPGKNAFCLRILKRSGEHVEIAAGWDSGVLHVWEDLWEMSEAVSGRFAHRYAALLKPLILSTAASSHHGWEPSWSDTIRDAAEAELRHVLKQQANLTDTAALQKIELWRPCLKSLSPRDYLHVWLAWAFLRSADEPAGNF